MSTNTPRTPRENSLYDSLFKSAMAVIGGAVLTVGQLIYQEVKDMNEDINKIMNHAIEQRKDIEFLKESDKEQSRRIQALEQRYFIKPPELKIKATDEND